MSDPNGPGALQRALRISEREEQAARREVARLSRKLDDGAQLRARIASANRLIAEAKQQQAEAEAAHAQAEHTGAEAQRAVAEAERRTAEERAARLALERELADLRVAGAELRDRGADLERETQRLGDALEGARRETAEREQKLTGVQAELSGARGRLERAEQLRLQSAAEQARRVRELQQTISTLSVGIGQVKEDIGRAAASRAWRYGHGSMRALARLARRPPRTEGALAVALARIERAQAAARCSPLPLVDSQSVPVHRRLSSYPRKQRRGVPPHAGR